MIFLIIDIILKIVGVRGTYFFLVSLIKFDRKEIGKLVILGLILDLLVRDTYFFNTIILGLLFLGSKKLINEKSFVNYIILLSLIYSLYIICLGLISKYSFLYIMNVIVANYLVNLVFWILSYKLRYKFI